MDTMSLAAAAAPATATAAGARGSALAFLEELEPAVAGEAADAVVLVVSELTTNALRHGGGTFTLRLTAHVDSIEVAVHDPSPQMPRTRAPDLTGATGGFGWPLINHLARTTGITRGAAGGKTITAVLPR
ncbi:ATP-binding protein [Streptomyces pratensis]|uniref:ATP-binding protein n=1 Tax=Streptomyces pratensis TaxID=1169025 RepID=UPI00301AD271